MLYSVAFQITYLISKGNHLVDRLQLGIALFVCDERHVEDGHLEELEIHARLGERVQVQGDQVQKDLPHLDSGQQGRGFETVVLTKLSKRMKVSLRHRIGRSEFSLVCLATVPECIPCSR